MPNITEKIKFYSRYTSVGELEVSLHVPLEDVLEERANHCTEQCKNPSQYICCGTEGCNVTAYEGRN